MKEDSGGGEFAFVRYLKLVLPLEKDYEALRGVSLQWATAGSAEEGHDERDEGQCEDSVMANEWFGVIPFQINCKYMYSALCLSK